MVKVFDFLILIIIFVNLKCIKGVQMMATHNWDYSLLSIYQNSSNEDLFNLDIQLERVGRGDFALSGYIDVKTEMGEDFNVFMETYRSKSGSGEFFKLPFSFGNLTIDKFMDTSYRTMIMKSMQNCSNFPQFVDPWEGPLPLGRLWLKMCSISADDVQISYLQEGYYKLHFYLTSLEMTAFLEVLLKINVKP